jgi:molecular chaperone IbpA
MLTSKLLEDFPSFKDVDKMFVGFDRVFDQLHDIDKHISNYPPYSIIKSSDTSYRIEMAVAGFSKSDIDMEIIDDKLIIKSKTDSEESESNDYIYKGLAFRPFTRTFTLNDQVEVKSAEMVDGLLKIYLERMVPEPKVKKLEIK